MSFPRPPKQMLFCSIIHLLNAAALVTLCGFLLSNHLAIGQTDDALLTLGNPAPAFDPDEFVQGSAFDKLLPGIVYVIEFSGTECKPCIKAIPLMEELQAKYSDVVFVSVFSSTVPEVQEFLKGPGRAMTGRVVSDADNSLENAWSIAAGRIGIPQVFVVDTKSKIAWMGQPNDLVDSLAKVVTGSHDYRVDAIEQMRLEIAKHTTLKRRRISEREIKANEFNNEQVGALIQAGKYKEAVALLDKAMETYRDLSIIDAFRARKLLTLGRISDSQDDAYRLAREIIVDAMLAGDLSELSSCHYLLNQFEFAYPENRDERMLILVLGYLSELDLSQGTPHQNVTGLRISARAHHLHGDQKLAQSQVESAIELQQELVKQVRESNGDAEAISSAEYTLEALRKELEDFQIQ